MMTVRFHYGKVKHALKGLWCRAAHRARGATNQPPAEVCLKCGTWLGVLLLCVAAAGCEADTITAPSAEPVVIDDGGQLAGEGNFSGGGQRTQGDAEFAGGGRQ